MQQMYDKPDVSEGESLQKTSIGYEHISNRQFFCVTRESGERPNKNESQIGSPKGVRKLFCLRQTTKISLSAKALRALLMESLILAQDERWRRA